MSDTKILEVGRVVPAMALKVFVDPWHLVAEEVRAMCDAMREAGADASRVELVSERDVSRQAIRFDMRARALPKQPVRRGSWRITTDAGSLSTPAATDWPTLTPRRRQTERRPRRSASRARAASAGSSRPSPRPPQHE